MNILDPETLDLLVEMAVDEIMRLTDGLMTALMPNGRAWGDVPADTDGDHILRYVDLSESGAMQTLPAVNPQLAQKIERQFVGAMGRQIESVSNG